MLRILLTTVARRLGRNLVWTIVNVSGLAVSLAAALLILVWIRAELSWDRFHDHADRILRVEQDTGWIRSNVATPFPAGPEIATSVPGVERVVRVASPGSGFLVSNGSVSLFETGVIFADRAFFDVFSFGPAPSSSPGGSTEAAAVITESTAQRYFGREDAVGRDFVLDRRVSVPIGRVIPDPPEGSTIAFDIVVPMHVLRQFDAFTDSWRSNWVSTWILVDEDADVDATARLTAELFKRNSAGLADRLESIILRPITDIHLSDTGVQGLYLFGALGVFILLLAIVNFTNLATSQAMARARETGMRRALGATRGHLVVQFLIESLAAAVAGAVCGFILAVAFLPNFRALSGKSLSAGDILSPDALAAFAGIVLVTGLGAGLYPAISLSRTGSVHVVRNHGTVSGGSSAIRRSLVMFQMFVSVTLVVGTITMVRQVEYLKTKHLGYDREQLIYVPLVTDDAQEAFDRLRSSWLGIAGVAGVSGSEVLPVNMGWNSYAGWEGRSPDEQVLIFHNRTAADFVETMGLDIVDGRSLTPDRPGDAVVDGRGGFMINESAAQALGGDVVGKEVSLGGATGPVVGVMRDFHTRSLRQPISPVAVMLVPQNVRYAILRLDAGWSATLLDRVAAEWTSVLPDHPLDVRFFDEAVEAMYGSETRLSMLMRIFAVLAVFIACLGLFGLTAFNVRRRVREFAVRRVLGASQVDVLSLVGREIVILLMVASVAATPLAWFVMYRWLEQFPYRIEPGSGPFVVGICIVGSIALMTVAYHAIRASGANPVDSLRGD